MNRLLVGLSRWLLPLLMLASCASQSPPRVVERSLSGAGPATHRVIAGETLYSIALRYDKDYRELARLNKLDRAFTIQPGQRLSLRGSPRSTAAVSSSSPAAAALHPVNSSNKSATKRVSTESNKTLIVKKPTPIPEMAPSVMTPLSASTSLAWVWPAKGALMGGFGAQGIAGKGLDILGKRGDSVLAAAAGTVVYAGSGLVGYGRMLILRHDDRYISAYAHNDRFLVKEGERVVAGQAIAVIGSSGSDREKLHFEIREGGKPVDPLRFLPAR